MTAHSLPYAPRHADPVPTAADAVDVRNEDDPAARDHALALLAASPVYARVARLLGVDGADPLTSGRTEIDARLGHLPDGWHVLSAVGVDHLVVGPAGVFAVSVRHHPDAAVTIDGDTVKVNGRHQRCVGDLRRRAARLGRSLSAAAGRPVEVRPVLAIAGGQRGLSIKRQPHGVTVVNRKTITPFLHAQPAVLDGAAVDRLATVIRPSTGR